MKVYDVLVDGVASTVQVLKFRDMPKIGESATVRNANANEIYYGGCGYNIWLALAKLGVSTYPILTYQSRLCDQKIREECRRFGAPTDGLYMPGDGSGYHCLMLENELKQHITISIPYGERRGDDAIFPSPKYRKHQFENSRFAVFVLLADEQALRYAKQCGVPVVFSYKNDPALWPKDKLQVMLEAASFLFTNEAEAQYLTELFGMKKITDLFQRENMQVIVTTMGENGCYVYGKHENSEYSKELVPITKAPNGVVDAVGAGDGFVAGFLYGYSRGKSLKTSAQYGNTVSSFVIEREGSTTNLPTQEEMLARNNRRPDASND
ncbi:carbohydrate kinase family protein [Diplocloster agilis]|uniref:carbohydrate kinase family protein n=1 Tax=Diplocloster agilis TaxID=2850323 RepID=UPI000820885B|nr:MULTISPECIES: carbohydrate kinase family protein [Lachnospiraceae]MBU9744436.1 carbohydrate kinase family protein [Diplocloster agilis]MCU6735776.1 carbohydrate kinase family protein [Suonthocola fibrivorans]SCJ81592.1 5-dehydro-2-deoxygluconokinase [uncultured Clostridium sp.]